MKYYINLHTRRGHPMGTIYGNNKKKLVEEAQGQMEDRQFKEEILPF